MSIDCYFKHMFLKGSRIKQLICWISKLFNFYQLE